MDNRLHIWGWHSESGLQSHYAGLTAQDLDRIKQGGGRGTGRDLKIIGDHYKQVHANKFGKLSERDNLVDVN